jgi:KUP system potassium uptake protein
MTVTATRARHAAPRPGANENASAALPRRLGLALAALGVVYGDLGTNVLFALRECFKPEPEGVSPTPDNVLSVLSLVFWALTLVVVVKYLTVVLRADNHGEGGILALMALLVGHGDDGASPRRAAWRTLLPLLGIFGTALLLADGMITPAVSVLSAVEGLEVSAPGLRPAVVPVTVAILVILFGVQRFGTEQLARLFGPIMLVWFAAIAVTGLAWIVQQPQVLEAVNPAYIVRLIAEQPGAAFMLLGAIVLTIAGAEALYADMGHFGAGPIRLAWYLVAFPALLLNYFGQGAYVLAVDGRILQPGPHGAAETVHLFYAMVPDWGLWPMLVLATLATVIASQALISGAYSLAEQGVQLGYCPRLTVAHTSARVMGQIYVPFVNWALMVACVLLVLLFKESSHLANAYGIAVVGTMTITSVLVFAVMRVRWGWPLAAAAALVGLFLVADLTLLAANLLKVMTGGWVPLAVGAGLCVVLTTWNRGRLLLADPQISHALHVPVARFLENCAVRGARRDEVTAVVLTPVEDMVPDPLVRAVERTGVMPGRMVLLTVIAQPVPTVPDTAAVEVRSHGEACWGVTARHGFLERPDVCRFLALCAAHGLALDPQHIWFYLSRMTLVPTGCAPLAGWRKHLFAVLYHNAKPASAYYRLPPDRVVELGRLVEF